MNATLDQIDAVLAACRADISAPGFRCRTATEHRAMTRRDLASVANVTLGGQPIPEPLEAPPSQESEAALAELLEEIRRLEKAAAELRAEESHRR